jgi:Lipoprotein LpqB beta-propeller domain
VFGRQFGTIDENGIYTPDLDGDGSGGARVSFEFKLKKVNGQFRIDSLRPGLLITDKQFAATYTQHSLFFYDNAHQYLVRDPRYSDLDDRTQLSKWLLSLLAAGPRNQLANTVSSDTLPTQADPTRITVAVGAPTRVEIPGSSQLDGDGRNRLAAQLSQTLVDPLSGGEITITDGGRPVQVPQTGSSRFGPSDFDSEVRDGPVASEVYYLAGGRVLAEDGKQLAGPLGRGAYNLASVALSRPASSAPMLAAGVQGIGAQAQLLVGTQEAGLRPAAVSGPLTRPAFAPGRSEVWIGSGARIYRVTIDAASSRVDRVPMLQVPGAGRVIAVRISPDGARIAVVLAPPKGNGGTLYIGSIVRGSGPTRIDALAAISPQAAVITDVAWLNPLRLFAIGHVTSSQDSLSFDTGVDGTDWTSRIVGLSKVPDAVTVTAGASAWVSADGFVWVQSAGQWVSPTGGQTSGTAPIYLE